MVLQMTLFPPRGVKGSPEVAAMRNKVAAGTPKALSNRIARSGDSLTLTLSNLLNGGEAESPR
jgi:hypothetical protein